MVIVYLYQFFNNPKEISTTQKDSEFQRLVQSEQLHTSEEKVLHLRLYTNIKKVVDSLSRLTIFKTSL